MKNKGSFQGFTIRWMGVFFVVISVILEGLIPMSTAPYSLNVFKAILSGIGFILIAIGGQ